MTDPAPSSEAPKYYSIKPGGDNLPSTLKSAVNRLKGANNIKNEVYIVPTAVHEAFTNMTYISLSGDYMGLAIHANYHGYSPSHLTEDLEFVVQHEIGHLNVHPTEGFGWMKEIKGMPVEGSKKGYWSNVLSDIVVNYNISNGTQLPLTSIKASEVEKMNHAVWAAYAGGYRSCMGSPVSAFNGQTLHRKLVEAGQLVNNLANGGVFTNPAPGNPYIASDTTPEWEKWTGHGRGPQQYCSIAYAVSHQMPVGTDMGPGLGLSTTAQPYPDNWKQIKVLASFEVEYCPSCEKWIGYNPSPGVCPIDVETCRSATSKEGKIEAGTYVVTGSRTYDGQVNTPDVRPIEFWEINYNGTKRWIPAHYCYSLCPHCGDSAPSQWELGFGYRPELVSYIRGGGNLTPQMIESIEKSRLMGLLLYYQIAGMYASSANYKGLRGVAAGELFLHDAAWDLHLCMIGQ